MGTDVLSYGDDGDGTITRAEYERNRPTRRCTGRVDVGLGMRERCRLPARHRGECEA